MTVERRQEKKKAFGFSHPMGRSVPTKVRYLRRRVKMWKNPYRPELERN